MTQVESTSDAMSAALPEHPTLLLGLGDFGRDVVRLAFAGAGRKEPESTQGAKAEPYAARTNSNLVVVPDGDPETVVQSAKQALTTLLDLSHFVVSTHATDQRGPRCDVVVVADLSDPVACERAPIVSARLAAELRREFKTIFGSGDGALAVVPILAVPRRTSAASASKAFALFEKASAAKTLERLGGRVYIVEDQSGKYLLSRAEMVRTFAAFLHLLLLSRLRDREEGARPLVEAENRDPSHCFATFSCATLLFDNHSLARKCAARLATEILGVFRTGNAPTIEEIGVEADRLTLSRADLEVELWKEGSGPGRDASLLSKHLDPPKIVVPAIEEDDSPEDIVERKFGPLWRAGVIHSLQAFRTDVERFKMDRLAAEIEHRGKACLERVTNDLATRTDAVVASGPRGHARAIDFLREALSRTKGDLSAIGAAIEAPSLSNFPASPLDQKLEALQSAVFARPRPLRMRVFGLIAAMVSTLLIAGLVRGALRFLAAPDPDFFDPTAVLPAEFPWILGQGITPLLIALAFASTSTSYRLYKHRKRHHNWVLEAQADLDQAMVRYVTQDMVRYFYERLDFARLLWLQRIYRAYKERLEEALYRLEGVRAALARSEHALAQEERRLDERLDEAKSGGGVLLRGVVAKTDAMSVYNDVRPPELTAVAARLLRDSLKDEKDVREKDGLDTHSAWSVAPFADPERLVNFGLRELTTTGSLSPFEHPSAALAAAVRDAVRALLRDVALKLSAPLETVAVRTTAEHLRRLAIIPPAARSLFDTLFASENVRGAWELIDASDDQNRVHLLVVQTDLDRGSLARGGDAIAGENR